ncbi:MAG: hypothetical protein BWK78_05795, partial [Thiotrichaceae bacterium IS1]
MKTEFLTKAQENLKAADLLLTNQLYNASANRAYYAAFQAAIAALATVGILGLENKNHDTVQAQFAGELIHRRKLYPGHFKSYLMDLQRVRNNADYREMPVSS